MEADTTPATRVRAFFARSEDPYRGGDLSTARRLGALLWVIGAALSLLVFPLSQPDVALGAWGWPVAALVVLGGVVGAHWMLHGHVTWDRLLVASYIAVAQLATLEWLAGGSGTPYAELYLLVALYAGALHPPRRLLGVLAAIVAASSAPLAYDAVTNQRLAQVALHILLIAAIALLASALMRTVRAQRIGLREASDEAEHLARIDALTELPNRRAFMEALPTEIARSWRFGGAVSLIIADVDGFKRINDVHGHQAGDACLRDIAAALQTTLRQYDSCFRWGGDEFALLLPETPQHNAEAVCRRVEAAVAKCVAPDGSALRITCAPAELADGMTGEDLVATADRELLRRKRSNGRTIQPA